MHTPNSVSENPFSDFDFFPSYFFNFTVHILEQRFITYFQDRERLLLLELKVNETTTRRERNKDQEKRIIIIVDEQIYVNKQTKCVSNYIK